MANCSFGYAKCISPLTKACLAPIEVTLVTIYKSKEYVTLRYIEGLPNKYSLIVLIGKNKNKRTIKGPSQKRLEKHVITDEPSKIHKKTMLELVVSSRKHSQKKLHLVLWGTLSHLVWNTLNKNTLVPHQT